MNIHKWLFHNDINYFIFIDIDIDLKEGENDVFIENMESGILKIHQISGKCRLKSNKVITVVSMEFCIKALEKVANAKQI